MKFSGKQVCIMLASSSKKPKVGLGEQKYGVRAPSLRGVQHDMNMFKDMFKKYPKDKVILIHSSIQNGLLSKKEILNSITESFNKVQDKVIFFYTGHGHIDNGDLLVETKENPDSDRITLEEFIKLWSNRKQKSKNENADLLLFMDSCYSGYWCERMEEIEEKTISIFSSCDQFQISRDRQKGGLFLNIVLGKLPDFQSTFQLLNKFEQTPRFISRGQTSGYLTQNNLKSIQQCILNALNIKGNPIEKWFDWQNIEEDLQFVGEDGKHQFTQTNGDKYDGYWKNGKKNGKGRMEYTNKQVYEGDWKDNRRHGKGKINFRNGSEEEAGYYDGEWQNDLPNGYGVYQYGGGYGHKGYWKQGKKHGKGQQYSKGYSYVGEWEEDQLPEFRNAYDQLMKARENQLNFELSGNMGFNYDEFEEQNQ